MPFSNKEKKKQYNADWKKKNRERVNQKAREARAARREEYNANVRQWTAKNKDKLEVQRIVRTYNISEKDFLQLKENSAGLCQLCGVADKLVVDHCHTTGKVRNLICVNCNWGLGHFKDSKDLLNRAIQYLEQYNE